MTANEDFGKRRRAIRAFYSSQERDTETALDFFPARYHANQQGRFLSADPG